MQNLILDRQLSDCKELHEAWKTFLELFNAAIRGNEALTSENEQAFLDNKSRIAMLHDAFMDALRHDQQVGQNIFSIIARCITMQHVNRMSPAETKKIEIEWHESYLLLNETISSLDEERQRVAAINPTTFHLQRIQKNILANLNAFVHSRLLKFAIGVAVVCFIIFGIPMFGIYDYDNLRNVKGASVIYFEWLNVKRTTGLDRTAPFGRRDDFEVRYLPPTNAPSGTNYEPGKTEKSAALKDWGRIPLEGGKISREILDKAIDFKAIGLVTPSNSSKKIEILLFLFYSNREAYDLASQIKKFAGNSDTHFTCFNINNCLVILTGDKDMRREQATKTFGLPAY